MKLDKIVWLLIVVSGLQTFAIIYLVNGFESLNKSIQTNVTEAYPSKGLDRTLEPIFSESSNTSLPYLDVTTLKQTIRQELDLYFKQNQKLAISSQPSPQPIDYDSDPRNLEQVEQQLQLIKAKGELSTRSLENFSFDVSKLAPDDRRAALSRLAKAINSGQVKNVN